MTKKQKKVNLCPRYDWIYLWLNCLTENEEYRTYCKAIREGELELKKQIEARHCDNLINIRELYGDWGDIHDINYDFDNWYKENEYLFIEKRKIEQVKSVNEQEQDFLYLKIPLRKNATEAVNDYDNFITKHYENNKEDIRTWPKYQMYNNRKWESDIKDILIMFKALMYYEEAGTTKETLNELIEWESDAWPEPYRNVLQDFIGLDSYTIDLMEKGKLQPKKLGSQDQENQIRKWIKSITNVIDNTVKGVFPKTK